MKKNRFIALVILIAFAFVLGACSKGGDSSQRADKKTNFPKRPIEMVIPFGAGGASDIFARQYAQIVEKYIGKPITAVNKGGAGTIEGLSYAFSAPADGYTIMEITPSLLIVEAQNKTSIKFRKEFEPLLKVQNDIVAFGVAANSQFKTIDELIAYAKANPKKIKIGGLSPGGLDDYIANGFSKEAGIELTYVPYKSGSEVKAAVLGGEIDIYQDKLVSFLPLVASKDIRPLVVLNEKKLDSVPDLKDVPSTVEKGINFTQGSWRAFVIKKGTPEDVKKIIIDALQKAYDDPKYKEMEQKEMTNIKPGYMKAEEFQKEWDKEYNGYVEVFTKLGMIKK